VVDYTAPGAYPYTPGAQLLHADYNALVVEMVDLGGASGRVRALETVYVNVKNPLYGAVGDNSTNDQAAIAAAIAAAMAITSTYGVATTVYFPPGTYLVSGGFTITVDGVSLAGAGEFSTAIRTTSTSAHLFSASSHRRLRIQDMRLIGAGSGSVDAVNLAAPSAYAVFDCVFRNVMISGFGRHGIYIEDACNCIFDHVRVESCGGDGFHLQDNSGSGIGGTSCAFTSCYANACTGNGYSFNALAYSSMNACSTDGCTIGYQLAFCTSISLNGCGVETPTGHGFALFNGTTSCTLNACYALNVPGTASAFRIGTNGGANVSRVVLNACRSLGATVPQYTLNVDSTCEAVCIALQRHPSAPPATTGTVTYLADENTGLTTLASDLIINTVGKGLQVKSGTNGRIGTATLSSGTVTIANTTITANTRVFAMAYNIAGTPGFLAMSGRTIGTNFVITSYTGAGAVNTADTSSFSWLLVETV